MAKGFREDNAITILQYNFIMKYWLIDWLMKVIITKYYCLYFCGFQSKCCFDLGLIFFGGGGSVISTYRMHLFHKWSQCAAFSSQTRNHILVMGQTVTVNTRASWHPAETFSNSCQIKEQQALLLFEAVAPQKPQEVYKKSSWWETGSQTVTNITAALEPLTWIYCCL